MHFFDGIIFGIIDNGVLIIGALFGLSIEKYLPKYFHKGIGTVFGAGIGNAVSDFLGGVPIAIDFAWGAFVHVPVLAKLAVKVTACGAKREYRGARQVMVKRLFLYRVDTEPAGATIGIEVHAAALVAAYKAEPALAIGQFTEARAQVALDFAATGILPEAHFNGTHRLSP